MQKELHFALDSVFLFTFILSILLFGLEFKFHIPEEVTKTTETIDYAIFGGYYAFFFYAIHRARNKIKYLKRHWILALLLIAPFFPFARIVKLVKAEEAIFIGMDGLWHVLDELEML